jgi:hypothetical protein
VAATFAGRAEAARLALVDGVPVAVWAHGGRPKVVFTFTISDGKITDIALDARPGPAPRPRAGRVRGRRRGLLLADGRGAGPRLARRLRNLDRDQRVTILVGFYDEDWPKVWRFRLRGTGRRESGAHARSAYGRAQGCCRHGLTPLVLVLHHRNG